MAASRSMTPKTAPCAPSKKIAQSDYKCPIVAAHCNIIAAVMGAIDLDFGFEQWRAMKNPHLYRLSFSGDALVLFEDLD